MRFQSSPALKDRCNRVEGAHLVEVAVVSILTGLERPVQRWSPGSLRLGLTFQSSPALKDRCNRALPAARTCRRGFQSSPALKDRCNLGWLARYGPSSQVSILTGLERPVQLETPAGRRPAEGFQSSPALKDRCNCSPAAGDTVPAGVSILTGLERPVQQEEEKTYE